MPMATMTSTLPMEQFVVEDGMQSTSWFGQFFGCRSNTKLMKPTYVGEGKGAWTQRLAEVGEGQGDFIWEEEKQLAPNRGWLWCLGILLLLAVIFAIVYAAMQQPQPALPPEQDVQVAPMSFHCSVPAEGAARAGAAIVYDAWRSIDRDQDGTFPLSSLQLWKSQGLFSAKAVQAIENRSADLKVNATNNDIFLEALGATSAAGWAEAAWLLADKDEDGFVKRTEMGLLQTSGTFRDAIDQDLFKMDLDNDGQLSQDEFNKGLENVNALHKDDLDTLFEVVRHKYWPESKRKHCCNAANVACGELTPIEPEYNCHEDYENRKNWPEEKIGYCCSRFRVACPTQTVAKFDCDDGYNHWEHAWTTEKKAWCCANTGKACEFSEPYDCAAGFSNWKAGWSDSKKAWCCEHKDRGCTPKFDCRAGFSNWRAGWSPAKKEWCCSNFERGCSDEAGDVPETAPAPYDCEAGFSNWRAGWSESKKAWCCSNEQRGCPDVVKPYDCEAGYSNWRAGWSDSKKVWCCDNEQRGCPDVVKPYDCEAGYSNWRAGWSDSKKVWCCDNEQRGCPDVSKPYDCLAGLSNWQAGWSVTKKQWCCQHESRGCLVGGE
eukprot:TRINITY_DN1710_c0_g1_i1.p1 TRINITY_DN1710_c0_g1~~TRINITY_DN1710_c0_g1_i1.p1  ORF type:complete len:676 (+),score=96.27 TRINITY_DN1710_c0_g1_i1:224-2029(+)